MCHRCCCVRRENRALQERCAQMAAALQGATEAAQRARAAEERLRSAAAAEGAAGEQVQAVALMGLRSDCVLLQRQLKESQRAQAKVCSCCPTVLEFVLHTLKHRKNLAYQLFASDTITSDAKYMFTSEVLQTLPQPGLRSARAAQSLAPASGPQYLQLPHLGVLVHPR